MSKLSTSIFCSSTLSSTDSEINNNLFIKIIFCNNYNKLLCPNWWKKSHCMLVRREACSQLCLGVKIGRNVHTARFKGRKCSDRPLQRAKCSYRPKLDRLKLDCPRLTTHSHATRLFPPIWTQNVVCTSSDMVVTIATMPPLVHNLLLCTLPPSFESQWFYIEFSLNLEITRYGMNIFLIEAGVMNISPYLVAEAQLAACRSTRKHKM